MFYSSTCKFAARVHLFASASRLVSPFCFHLLEGKKEKRRQRKIKTVFICATLFIGGDIHALRGCVITQTCTPGRSPLAHGSVTGKQPSTVTEWAWASSAATAPAISLPSCLMLSQWYLLRMERIGGAGGDSTYWPVRLSQCRDVFIRRLAEGANHGAVKRGREVGVATPQVLYVMTNKRKQSL